MKERESILTTFLYYVLRINVITAYSILMLPHKLL